MLPTKQEGPESTELNAVNFLELATTPIVNVHQDSVPEIVLTEEQLASVITAMEEFDWDTLNCPTPATTENEANPSILNKVLKQCSTPYDNSSLDVGASSVVMTYDAQFNPIKRSYSTLMPTFGVFPSQTNVAPEPERKLLFDIRASGFTPS